MPLLLSLPSFALLHTALLGVVIPMWVFFEYSTHTFWLHASPTMTEDLEKPLYPYTDTVINDQNQE